MSVRKSHVELARDIIDERGGRVEVRDICGEFFRRLNELDPAAETWLIESARLDYVARCLRQPDRVTSVGRRAARKGAPLPWAVSIGRRRYVQRGLLTLSERRDIIHDYRKRGVDNNAIADALVEETHELFGVWITAASRPVSA